MECVKRKKSLILNFSNILKNAFKLKFIGRLGVGLDNIDTEYCKNKKIW